MARKLEDTDQPLTEPVEAIAANNVVDGLELQRRWLAALKSPAPVSDPLTALFTSIEKKPPQTDLTNSKAILEAELNSLADSVDAVSDALMAESVYQVVRGNPLRAASTVESIAGGETPPPELEVVRTPRTGIALTHRLVTFFSGEPALPPEWATPENPFRANAEPHLNAWAAKLLGNPANVRCVVERLDPATGKVLETKEIRLHQLRLAPLDFIYAVEGGQGGQQADIEQRIQYTITRMDGGFAAGSLLRVNPNRRPEWNATELSYGEFSELLRTARRLITGVRGIDADDLNPPERSTNFSVDVVELEKRAADAEQGLRQTLDDLIVQLAMPDTASLERLRELMLRAAGFGVAGAIPLSAAGNAPADRQTLLAQAGSIQKDLVQRIEQLAQLATGFNAGTAKVEGKRDHALAQAAHRPRQSIRRAAAFYGSETPRSLRKRWPTVQRRRTAIRSPRPPGSNGWRACATAWARLNATLSYAEALGTGEKLKLTIAQLPFDPTDRWVGLPLKTGQSLPGGKLSLVVQSAAPVDVHQPLAGLLIDEWVEVVPNASETTGISLQYDQPNAAPPQTILVAVPPEIESPWTVWSLQQVLLETLDLARIRAVDPDALDEVGHYLPALYFACNTAGDTVSTDFTTIK